ncbi:hypothetical protein GN958_ATG05400, partial [Phytophthora infestans]
RNDWHQREVETLTGETKNRLEVRAAIIRWKSGSASTEKEEGLKKVKSQMLAEIEMPRANLAEVSSRNRRRSETLKDQGGRVKCPQDYEVNPQR